MNSAATPRRGRSPLRSVFASARIGARARVLTGASEWALVCAWVCTLASFPGAGSAFADQATLPETARFAAIAPIVEAEIAAGHIPGAVVLIGQRERVLYAQAFGDRVLPPAREAMTLDTVFDLASLTKVVVTTTAVLQLAERGALSLDAPAARYWPAFAAHDKERITIRQLLVHTSGLPAGLPTSRCRGAAEALRRIADVKPIAQPDGAPHYSDVNFAALGEIVRRVGGSRLDLFAARHILQPLAMSDSGFLPPATKLGRIAPTERSGGAGRRGVVQDPLAACLDGVAGHAGLFATAADLSRFAQALLTDGAPLLSPASVRQLFAPQTYPAVPPRGLGWRLEAPLAANRAALPPLGAASHLGYTGGGLWIDPVSGFYLIVLSNRGHADRHVVDHLSGSVVSQVLGQLIGHVSGQGDAGPLRARVVAAVAEALGPLPGERIVQQWPELADRVAPLLAKPVPTPVLTGIDVLAASGFAPLQGLRIGLLTHRSGVDRAGRRSIDVLARAPGVRLQTIFSPEHGLDAQREGRIGDDTDLRTGLTIRSLYGATPRPSAAMLDGLDAVVVDLQDAGARFYTYASTVAYLLEAAAPRGLPVIVLDRPNPLGGAVVQGPLLDPERRSFTGVWPLPVRHGLTLGEFARFYAGEAGLASKLSVIAMQGYRRQQWFDDTGLPWLPPSPNLTSLAAAVAYPGVGMIEAGEVSVGRGTSSPFELVGAPWIDAGRLSAELELAGLSGVHFTPASFTPVADRYAGQSCHGVRITITDRDALDTPALGVALAAALHRLYPQHFTLDRTLGSIGNQATLTAIRAGEAPQVIASGWKTALDAYRGRRERYLIYR